MPSPREPSQAALDALIAQQSAALPPWWGNSGPRRDKPARAVKRVKLMRGKRKGKR